jgi:hypothetical protein
LNNHRGFWLNQSQDVIMANTVVEAPQCCAFDPGDDGVDGITYVAGVPTAVVDGETVFFTYGGDDAGWGYYDHYHHWRGVPGHYRAHWITSIRAAEACAATITVVASITLTATKAWRTAKRRCTVRKRSMAACSMPWRVRACTLGWPRRACTLGWPRRDIPEWPRQATLAWAHRRRMASAEAAGLFTPDHRPPDSTRAARRMRHLRFIPVEAVAASINEVSAQSAAIDVFDADQPRVGIARSVEKAS